MLSQADLAVEERDFFKQPFSRDELLRLLDGQSPRAVFNFRSQAFKKSGLQEDALGDEDLLGLMLEEPRYLKRPLVVLHGKLIPGATEKQLQGELGVS